MNGTQYEECCRLFLANELRIPIREIRSDMIPNTIRPGSTQYSQQIDFWWQDENNLIEHVNIADAKCRSSNKVEKGDVEKLMQAKEGIAAHKAIMITNNDFTKGARAVAENHRIALHIVCPNFDYTILNLDMRNRRQIQAQLRPFFASNKPAYSQKLVCKGVDVGTDAVGQSSDSSNTDINSKGRVPRYSNKMVQPRSYTQKIQGAQSSSSTSGRGGSVQKGPGPSSGRIRRSKRGR